MQTTNNIALQLQLSLAKRALAHALSYTRFHGTDRDYDATIRTYAADAGRAARAADALTPGEIMPLGEVATIALSDERIRSEFDLAYAQG